jgi:membrane fusion protein (multidrug efflux system)
MKRFLTRFLLPALITGASVAGAVMMVRSAESAEREPPTLPPPLVEHVEVATDSVRPRLWGNGVVEPAHEATLSPELSGRITYLSPALVVGGRVKAGEVLLRIDRRNYEIAVQQQRAQVAQRQVELELEQAYGKVAKREWDAMGDAKADGRLASRLPQREAAEVNVEGARSTLERARLDLDRTVIRAPFNATIRSETVEEGEIATPGQVVATLVGTDELWVRVSIPVEHLGLIGVPGRGAGEGARARVVQRLGARGTVERPGRVIRLVNEIDPESRTAQVLVEVERPFDPPPGELPLLPGAFVEVELEGQEPQPVIAVPRLAVIDGHHAWVVDGEQRLRKRRLEVAWGDPERVYATAGLSAGDRVVVTPPPGAVEGMQVRSDARAPSQAEAASERVSAAGHEVASAEG